MPIMHIIAWGEYHCISLHIVAWGVWRRVHIIAAINRMTILFVVSCMIRMCTMESVSVRRLSVVGIDIYVAALYLLIHAQLVCANS